MAETSPVAYSAVVRGDYIRWRIATKRGLTITPHAMRANDVYMDYTWALVLEGGHQIITCILVVVEEGFT